MTKHTLPKGIQRKRTKGWRMPPGAVYDGRPTKWGNPFSVAAHGQQDRPLNSLRGLFGKALFSPVRCWTNCAARIWPAGATLISRAMLTFFWR